MGGKAKGQFNLFHSHFVFAMHPPKILLWLLPLVCAFSLGALADTAVDPSQALHLLSYLAADYPPTVADGKIVDPSEYQEQMEFVGNLQALVLTLPMRPERAELERGVASLRQAIEQRLPGRDVALQARNLEARVADIYQVGPPRSPPTRAARRRSMPSSARSAMAMRARATAPPASAWNRRQRTSPIASASTT